MNRRIIAFITVFLMLSCSVFISITFANDEQDKNQPSQSSHSTDFVLSLEVYTYEKLFTTPVAHPLYYDARLRIMDFSVQLINIATNEVIEPTLVDYRWNITYWNLSGTQTYSLTLSKEGYITQTFDLISERGVAKKYQIYPIYTVLVKNSAPQFIRLLDTIQYDHRMPLNWFIFFSIKRIIEIL